MISVRRTYGLLVRHLYLLPRSPEKWIDLVFWPMVEMLIWGTTAVWIASVQGGSSDLVLSILLSLAGWRLLFVTSYEFGVNFLEECISRNITNLLSTPLSKSEWLISVVVLSLIKQFLLFWVLALAVYLFFGVSLLSLGWTLLPTLLLLAMCGWVFGALAVSLLLLFGIRAQSLTWTSAYFFAPLTGAYFPLDLLPQYLQRIGALLPPTPLFQGLRAMVIYNEPILPYMGRCLLLLSICLPISIGCVAFMFSRSQRTGFDHLE